MSGTQRIRTLQIIAGLAVEGPLGGIERFGIELTRSLDHRQMDPILCGLWRFDTPYEEERLCKLRQQGISTFIAADWEEEHPYRSFWRSWRGILSRLSGERVDVIHSHCQFGDGIAILIAGPLGAQAIVRTVHNEREWPRRPLRKLFLTSLLYPLAFRLEIGVSQQVTENLQRRPMSRLLGKESLYIPNAIDLHRFACPVETATIDQKRSELGFGAQETLIGSIGRLSSQKGYSVLLEAMPMILEKLPSARLIIIGEGELAAELRGLARDLGIEQKVTLLGARQDIDHLLAAMDLFVSSSLWEGLPTVILESMASLTPVVATDVSGTRELIEDGVTGRLVPPGDPGALARVVLESLRDQEKTVRMSRRALHLVQDFSIERVAERHIEFYGDLIS